MSCLGDSIAFFVISFQDWVIQGVLIDPNLTSCLFEFSQKITYSVQEVVVLLLWDIFPFMKSWCSKRLGHLRSRDGLIAWRCLWFSRKAERVCGWLAFPSFWRLLRDARWRVGWVSVDLSRKIQRVVLRGFNHGFGHRGFYWMQHRCLLRFVVVVLESVLTCSLTTIAIDSASNCSLAIARRFA